jgi:hypothetical protein
VPHSNPPALDENADDIEAVGLFRAPMSPNPSRRRPGKLSLFRIGHRFDRIPELQPATSLHLDERDRSVALDYEIDVSMPHAESTLNDAPSLFPKPPFGDAFAELSELLLGR